MELRIEGQLYAALLSIGTGIMAGAFYDILGTIRRRSGSGIIAAIVDGLYWLICAAAMFTLGLSAGEGNQRLFMLALAILGAIVYFLFFGHGLREILDFFGDGIGYIVFVISLPIKKFWIFSIKMCVSVKKVFSDLNKRYKIKIRKKASKRTKKSARSGGEDLEIQTYRYFYETDNNTSADLCSGKPNKAARKNRGSNNTSGGAGTAGGGHHRRK